MTHQHYRIMARKTEDGEAFECFTWVRGNRGISEGIARVYRDAKEFDVEIDEVWAEAIEEEEEEKTPLTSTTFQEAFKNLWN